MAEDGQAARRQVGQVLRQCREGFGRRLDQVAAETQVRAAYLTALESGDYSAFPGDFWAQQFLRSYAQYLGLPAEELVRQAFPPAEGRGPAGPALAPRVASPGRTLPVGRRRDRRGWAPFALVPLFALLAAAVLVAAIVFLNRTATPHPQPAGPRITSRRAST